MIWLAVIFPFYDTASQPVKIIFKTTPSTVRSRLEVRLTSLSGCLLWVGIKFPDGTITLLAAYFEQMILLSPECESLARPQSRWNLYCRLLTDCKKTVCSHEHLTSWYYFWLCYHQNHIYLSIYSIHNIIWEEQSPDCPRTLLWSGPCKSHLIFLNTSCWPRPGGDVWRQCQVFLRTSRRWQDLEILINRVRDRQTRGHLPLTLIYTNHGWVLSGNN